MRVVIYNDCDSRGGVLTYTLTMSAALREHGAETIVITHEPASDYEGSIIDDLTACSDSVRILPKSKDVLRDVNTLSECLIATKCDIFIPNYRQVSHAAAAICSRKSKIKSIGICHSDHISSYNQKIRYERCLYKIVCPSIIATNKLKMYLPSRVNDIVHIPHGVRILKEPCKPFKGGVLKIIYHGRLIEKPKRISLIIEIARRLALKKVPFHLTLIGDGEDKNVCISASRDPALRNYIDVHDSKDWSELSSFLSNNHVVILTSEYEGFCLSLAEGMGAGLPAIAFHCGGVIESFVFNKETGLLVENSSIDEFIAAIEKIQSDPELWNALSRNARNLISTDYSWKGTIKKYITVFEEVLLSKNVRKWPLIRPVWIPTGGRSCRSVIERIGKEIGVWM